MPKETEVQIIKGKKTDTGVHYFSILHNIPNNILFKWSHVQAYPDCARKMGKTYSLECQKVAKQTSFNVDNINLGLGNSSYHPQPHPITV